MASSLALRAIRLVPTLAAIGVIGLTVSLGNWQMRRAQEKASLQALHDQALRSAPVDLATVGASGATPAEGAPVTATGHFLPDQTIFIDNRTHAGIAGFHVLTPLRLDADGRTVLVLRGWIRGDPSDRRRLPAPATPAQAVTVVGWYEKSLPQPIQLAKEPVPAPADRIWLFFSFDKFRVWSGLAVDEAVIRQTSDLPDGLVRDWTVGGIGVSTHYGYAFQWYALAVVTAALWLWYRRPRRRQAQGTAVRTTSDARSEPDSGRSAADN